MGVPRKIFEECKWYTSIFDTWELSESGLMIDLTRLIIIHLFIAWSSYTADIQKLVESLGFGVKSSSVCRVFHESCKALKEVDMAGYAMCVVNEVKIWMSLNRLQSNEYKTRLIRLGTLPRKAGYAGDWCCPVVHRCRKQSESTPTPNWLWNIELAFESLCTLVHTFTSRVDHYGSCSYSRLAAVCTEFGHSLGC